MSEEGKIINFEIASGNGSFDLLIDYYPCDAFTNVAKAGKISRIGNVTIDYYPYDNYGNVAKSGKIAQVGNIFIDYYPEDLFTDRGKWGKISKIRGVDARVDLVIEYMANTFYTNRKPLKDTPIQNR